MTEQAKPTAVERAIDRLIVKHQLDRIEFAYRPKAAGREYAVAARAYPANYSPVVRERREAALAERAKEGDTMSLAEATRINEDSLYKPVAQVTALTQEAAVEAIKKELEK